MRVAFFLTVTDSKGEDWWYDQIKVTSAMRKTVFKHVENIGSVKTLRIDYAVGYYLQHLLIKNNVQVDLIEAKDVVVNKTFRPKEYDLIITQFLSPLAVFQVYKERKGNEYDRMLKRNESKVYPPPSYTAFIEDKCAYGDLLRKHDIPSPPQVCLTKTVYDNAKSKRKLIESLQTKWEKLTDADEVFAKPILGTGSWGVKVMKKSNTKQIESYLKTIFEDKKYPKVMFQPYYPDFGTTFKELRYVFVGDKHVSTVTNSLKGEWSRPKQEVRTYGIDVPQYHMLKNVAKYIIDRILKPRFFKNGLPMLETRVDFGCCLNQVSGYYFVNEVEYAGGVLTFMDKRRQFDIHEHFATQLKKVVKWYLEKKK